MSFGAGVLISALAFELVDEAVMGVGLLAVGAISPAMLADTMIPEAFEEHHNLTGLTASVGSLTAFTVHHLG